MPIDHPSMRKAKTVSKQASPESKSYVVENADAEQVPINPIPAELINPVPQQTEKDPDIPRPFVDNILEDLIFLGHATKEVEIGNLTFTIATLTHKDNTSLMRDIYNTGEGADLFTIRTITLSYALTAVNGILLEDIPLDESIDESEIETPLGKKRAIINRMQRGVIEKIHDEYVKLSDGADASLSQENEEQLKKS